jgi:hypothetical protein
MTLATSRSRDLNTADRGPRTADRAQEYARSMKKITTPVTDT